MQSVQYWHNYVQLRTADFVVCLGLHIINYLLIVRIIKNYVTLRWVLI